MNEAEWLTARDPQAMLHFLDSGGPPGVRKLRLFACACCRSIWYLLRDKRSRRAVIASEQYADGLVTQVELRKAGQAAWEAACRSPAGKGGRAQAALQRWTWDAVRVAQYDNRLLRSSIPGAVTAVLEAVNGEGPVDLCILLRDICGNPFRPPASINHAWLDWNGGTVRRLAEAAYDQRSLSDGLLDRNRLGILADALEEAGCRDHEVLTHLREPGGVHVRGCHVVDLLLGKS
jgi:hypothetical protein